MIFDVVTLTSKVDLLYKKIDLDYDFRIRGVTYCCYLYMVAAGKLCCLSDNSGSFSDKQLPDEFLPLPELLLQQTTCPWGKKFILRQLKSP